MKARVVAYWARVDASLGERVAQTLGVTQTRDADELVGARQNRA
jgi:catalase